ncbi:malate dehydrogenase-like [Venturia canescens]|uniref:malate dehydrogenase-like n=1 Tax=Venturia canescens TaxID=32260 RepID=UPI001C9C4111|nr:malate dehydrogenase-like [Venturia canescens]
MFLPQKHCRTFLSNVSKIQFASCQQKIVEPGPKAEHGESKKSTDTSSSFNDRIEDDCTRNRGDVKIGIIGGGMTPIYASLLLKQCKLIERINIADPNDELANAANDCSHIDTSTKIKYYGRSCLTEALHDVDIIALMDEKDFSLGKLGPFEQFSKTSSYISKMANCMAQTCPSALVAVFARPVTASLPMVSEVYNFYGWWDPNRIIGSCAIDAMRIESMTANLFDLNPSYLSVPIVGGADPCTVVPILSKAKPYNQFSPEHEAMLVRELRSADKELASSSSKGPSLSSGVAASKLLIALTGALCGRPNVTCSAYVRSDVLPVCRFFTNDLLFGRQGVEKNYGLPKVSRQAVDLIEQSIPHINDLSEMAIKIVRTDNAKK